jgi:diguanylate cyclase (GGDEF)-like protein
MSRWMASRLPTRVRVRLPGGFGIRLGLALLFGLLASAAASYVLLERHLEHEAVRADVAVQRADVQTFQRIARMGGRAAALREIGEILYAIGARPGVREAKLIGPGYRILAGGDPAEIGTVDRDAGIVAALTAGRSYAGREADPDAVASDLEYLAPVRLFGQRHVFEITRTAREMHARTAAAGRSLAIAALLGLALGILAFLPLGGRLLREHRLALQNATLDGLTRLPNHRAFADELDAAVARAGRHGEQLAVAALDLDDFKFANDRHGHRHGDEMLRRVARVLHDRRGGDRAFRTGGDEFVVLMPRTTEDGARTAAARLLERLRRDGVTASAGVANLRPGADHEALHQQADAALYEAKRRGGGIVVGFAEIAHLVSVVTGERGLALRALLEADGAHAVYQPIWDLRESRLLAVEALARFPQEYGFGGPAEAFDVAEQVGRVHDLDVLCVRRALERVDELPPEALLFLNLAPQTLDRDATGDDWLAAAVADAGLDPARVVIEVTERAGARTTAVLKAIHHLRERGFRIAIDDVGSGNSGLEMLRGARPDFIKVDRSIVATAADDPASHAVLLAITAFAAQSGSYLIAEGIEELDSLSFLRTLGAGVEDRLGVDGAQGYGLGRPGVDMPPSRLELGAASV